MANEKNGWTSGFAIIAFLISGAALVQSMRAIDAAGTAVQQEARASRETWNKLRESNRERARLRRDLNTVSLRCNERIDAVIETLDAVARSCPGRARAPRLLDEARKENP